MRSPKNRNRAGGNINDMMLFNDIIWHLELAEINFHGRSFKQVRAGLKFWRKELSKLHFVLALLDSLEEHRSLSSLESAS
jgi:hypothetical protein